MAKTDQIKQRDFSIDVLRWLALSGIILVHIQPSLFWSQLRSFDVPMMVFLSAYCYAKGNKVMDSYKSYCVRRFKRLVFPCWIFLTIWFVFYHGVFGFPVDWFNIGLCFTLMTPWYLWIIRIFVLMALLAPLVTGRVQVMSVERFAVTMFFGLILNEILCHVFRSYLYVAIVMTFSYLLVFMYGVYIDRLKNKQILTIGGGTAAAFVCMAGLLWVESGNFVLVGKYKYPPHFYYLAYALMCISFLWLLRSKMETFLRKIRLLKIAAYIGSHTLWIYLWHIPMVLLIGQKFNATVRFAIVYVSAIIMASFQAFVVKRLSRHIRKERLRENLKFLLIG